LRPFEFFVTVISAANSKIGGQSLDYWPIEKLGSSFNIDRG
jgi:hypothetical protein